MCIEEKERRGGNTEIGDLYYWNGKEEEMKKCQNVARIGGLKEKKSADSR